jgi:transcriptional regulator with XRE-family HTH domain
MQPERARHHVAEEVRVLMARHRTSQEALARAIGIAQSTLSMRLRGETSFDVDELSRIAGHFGVDVTALLPRDAA